MKRDLLVTDPQLLLKRIKQFFPDLQWNNFRFITHSWDYQIVILDNSFVFRFPSSSTLLEAFKQEMSLLDLIRTTPDVSIPHYTFVAPDYSFGGYDIINGHELSAEKFHKLTSGDIQCVAELLGIFLHDLHNTKFPPSVALGNNALNLIKEDVALHEKISSLLSNRLSASEQVKAKTLLEAAQKTRGNFSQALIHGDLYWRHIFWEQNTKQLGLIDFSDMSLGDPALDFAELFEYGPDFVQACYKAYAPTQAESPFLERALLYYQRVGVFLMINSIEDTKITFEDAYKIFQHANSIQLT